MILEISFELIEDLYIPRTRDSNFQTRVLSRYERREEDVSKLIRGMFLTGVSTRRVGELMEVILGYRVSAVSAQAVSNVCKEIDKEVKKFYSLSFQNLIGL